MPNIQHLRTQAFRAQQGLCYYCDLPMWERSPDELTPLCLSPRKAASLRCIAEHLIAQQDGGRAVRGNIAAACWICNSRRHKRKFPPSPDAYRALVQKRMARGKWHPQVGRRLLAITSPLTLLE
ncbi:HNH endonuclease [Lysobacter capsici]|uniref:HNH endonuclease n=1 Tax=Lysobacter capsici TaxID=435897 RepID=UPI000BBB0284|nr:hypothetical protein CNO08_05055 [Lysobacter capsici]